MPSPHAPADTGPGEGTQRPSLDIVIVNFRSVPLVLRCLQSIARHPPAGVTLAAIRIEDNSPAESDWSGLSALTLPVILSGSGGNAGFGRACNRAAAASVADLLLFLNPDTEILARTLDWAAAALLAPVVPRRGAVGVQLLDAAGRVQRTCSVFPTPSMMLAQALGLHRLGLRAAQPFMADWDHGDSRPVDQVMGAFLLMRRRDFQAVGGFDRRYFLYYEDLDLCRRLRAAGLTVQFLATAQALHLGGGSSRTAVDLRLTQWLRSRVLYCRRWFGRPAALAVLLLSAVVEPTLRLGQALVTGEDVAAVLRGIAGYWRDLPALTVRILRRTEAPSPDS